MCGSPDSGSVGQDLIHTNQVGLRDNDGKQYILSPEYLRGMCSPVLPEAEEIYQT